ncbi:MAG: hypothetical protein PHX04_05785 [Bacilli bacterium]|nr:hypothetical protein [Bacilli bacterium]
MIFLDFIILNSVNIFMASVLLNTVYLNDKILYLILILDIILNGFPIITIIIIIMYYFKIIIFKNINENIINLLILLSIYYFIFGTLIYGIYNNLSLYIGTYLIKNYLFNLMIFIIGLKYIFSKYTLVGDIYDS